jgi:hypothetical protein
MTFKTARSCKNIDLQSKCEFPPFKSLLKKTENLKSEPSSSVISDRSFKMCVLQPRDVELVLWHSEKHSENNEEIRHLADGTQWKTFDIQYAEFAAESRNIRFTLITDGMNLFDKNRTGHSTWPVIFVMYNIST